MKTEEIKVKLSKLTRRKNEEVERQFAEFSERTKGFKGISIQDINGYEDSDAKQGYEYGDYSKKHDFVAMLADIDNRIKIVDK